MDCKVIYSIFLLQILLFTLSNANDIHCGGFIKSTVPIKYSKVEVKLFTASGILKYQTECAPNNGYFMIPFVEKEKFELKVVPPEGWSFEPSSVSIDVNGEDDKCTLGEDINFVFTGFTVSGQVLDYSSTTQGPPGVKLILLSADGTEVSQSVSNNDGAFKFNRVLSGTYQIKPIHDSLSFSQTKTTVVIGDDNTGIPTPIKVTGYDIKGRVVAENSPVKGVHVMLLSSGKIKDKIPNCNTELPKGAESVLQNRKTGFVCCVMSNDDGVFLFESLQPADYTIVPFYKGEHIKFDMKPQEMKFTIGNGITKLSNDFVVTGFSVTGSVFGKIGGNPVQDAQIFVDGKHRTTTSASGIYILQHMNTQAYTLTAEKKGYTFEPLKVTLGPNTPRLPDFIAKEFTACGKVEIDVKPLNGFTPENIAVKLNGPKDFKSQISKLNKDGEFCFNVPNGKYDMEMWMPKNVQMAGLMFKPASLEVTMDSAPTSGLKFTQVSGTVSVVIKCVGSCAEGITVALNNAEYDRSQNQVLKASKSNETIAVFNNVLPGSYTAKVSHTHWCMDKQTDTVEVTKDDLHVSTTFAQKGFQLVCTISHDVAMGISLAKEKAEQFELKKGRNTLCMAKRGKYTLHTQSCHRFDPDTVVYDTDAPRMVVMQATKHRVLVAVESSTSVDKVIVDVASQTTGAEEKLTLELKEKLTKSKEETTYLYEGSYWGRDKEKVTLKPSSDVLLFNHNSYDAVVDDAKCDEELFRFDAFKGMFIEGKITPPLADVKIQLHETGSDRVYDLVTDKHGKYRHGPLHPRTKLIASASLDNYVFTKDSNQPFNFNAKKLASIEFQVVGDKAIPLSGVLLTVSGGSYRSNNVTDNDGKLKLNALQPGEFYFKVIKKEYQFDPPSKLIVITEGSDVVINIVGQRVAFSCYGSVTSLNGQPERNVKLQAVGTGACSHQVEEGETNVDGEYRLKGLLPQCVYQVKVKDLDDHQATVPVSTKVQTSEDITDVNFIAIFSQKTFYISGNVVTDYQFLPNIKILLYETSNLNSAIQVITLSDSSFFYLDPIPLEEDKEYQIRMETTLDANKYNYHLPAASFYSTGGQKHVTLKFNPTLIPVEAEMPTGSFITLPLALLIIAMVYYHMEIFALIQQLIDQYITNKPTATTYSKSHSSATTTSKPRGRSRRE